MMHNKSVISSTDNPKTQNTLYKSTEEPFDHQEGDVISSTTTPDIAIKTNQLMNEKYEYEDIDFENNELSFLAIVRWLLWKNFIQQWQRRKFSVICKLIFPALCIVLIGCLKLFVLYLSTKKMHNFHLIEITFYFKNKK